MNICNLYQSTAEKNITERFSNMAQVNPKRAGLFGPISQPGGGGADSEDLGNRSTKYQVCGTSG